jgi:hypothetical protein
MDLTELDYDEVRADLAVAAVTAAVANAVIMRLPDAIMGDLLRAARDPNLTRISEDMLCEAHLVDIAMLVGSITSEIVDVAFN